MFHSSEHSSSKVTFFGTEIKKEILNILGEEIIK